MQSFDLDTARFVVRLRKGAAAAAVACRKLIKGGNLVLDGLEGEAIRAKGGRVDGRVDANAQWQDDRTPPLSSLRTVTASAP